MDSCKPAYYHKAGGCSLSRLGSIFSIMLLSVFLSSSSAAQQDSLLPLGAYRFDMIMATRTRIPFFGSSKSASQSVSLVEIRKETHGLVQSHHVCDFRVLEDSAMVKMIFPDKFVAALAKHTYPIQFERDAQGWRYRADLGVEQIGYASGSGGGPLPTKMDDPAVYDWDGDGRPGATLKLSVPLLPDGELYVVQRGHSILNGRLTQPGKIEGAIEVKIFEQRVLGANRASSTNRRRLNPIPRKVAFRSRVSPRGAPVTRYAKQSIRLRRKSRRVSTNGVCRDLMVARRVTNYSCGPYWRAPAANRRW